jgi:CheY-like chemotaxis protein
MRKQFAAIIGSSIVMMLMSCSIIRLNRERARSYEESFIKSFFMARMSHEMRTPLNVIIGLSEVEMQNDLPQNTSDNLEKIYNSGSDLLGIVNDILDISKIESENFELALTKYNFAENRSTRGKQPVRTRMSYGRVLVVDDVPTNLDVARGLMLPYGLEIDTAAGGREAIEKIRSEETRYDVVFMDHMMPEMDGIETIRVIRDEIGTDYARTVPVIALTANALRGNEEMFLSNGFDAFISKPIDIMQLDAVLNRWIRDKHSWKFPPREKQSAEDKPAPGAPAARRVEGVDLSAGVERYGSEEVYLHILRSFMTHTPWMLGKMREVSRETLAEYAVSVHGLKGSIYGICAETVARRAQALESAAKSGDFETIHAKNGIFIETVETLLSALHDLLGDSLEDFEKESKDAPDGALLAKLLSAAERFDFTEMDEILTDLERYRYESDDGLVTWLRKELDGLEYDEIRKRLEEIVKKTEGPP